MIHQSTTKRFTTVPVKALCAVSLTVLMSMSAHAQSTPATALATMPMSDMHKGATGETKLGGMVDAETNCDELS